MVVLLKKQPSFTYLFIGIYKSVTSRMYNIVGKTLKTCFPTSLNFLKVEVTKSILLITFKNTVAYIMLGCL